jgi:hypothetical protein
MFPENTYFPAYTRTAIIYIGCIVRCLIEASQSVDSEMARLAVNCCCNNCFSPTEIMDDHLPKGKKRVYSSFFAKDT